MSKRSESWIGKRESDQLEFKREDVEDDKVLAVVVALLNTKGGDLVIGVDAPEDVASAVTGVREPHALSDRLRKIILDRIDPPPYRLFEVDVVGTLPGAVILISVRKSDTLHAVRRGASLTFYVRQGDMNRAVDVREVARRLGSTTAQPDEAERAKKVFDHLLKQEKLGAERAIDLVVCGTALHSLEEDRWRSVRSEVRGLLSTEAPLGLRRNGWTFALSPHVRPEAREDSVRLGRLDPLFRFVETHRNGLVWGAMRFDSEGRGGELRRNASGREYLQVLDLAVAEYTVSITRLADHVWRLANVQGDVYFHVALLGQIAFKIGSLRTHAPRTVRDLVERVDDFSRASDPVDLPVETGVVRVPAADLYKAPDAVACRLVTRVFGEAGAEGWERYWVGDRFVPPS